MRLVLLTAHTPDGDVQHRYIASILAECFGPDLVAIITASRRPQSYFAKVSRWYRKYRFSEMLSRLSVKVYRKILQKHQQEQRTYRAMLFPRGEAGTMQPSSLVRSTTGHNTPEAIRLLNDLKPDIVVVYGTLLIGTELIAACPRILNLHTGMSPYYRGSDTIFWPIHNKQPEHIGVTVHRLEKGIDSGPILAVGRPKIVREDNIDTLFAKCVQLGGFLLCRAIHRELDGRTHPMIQDLACGKEYRSVDRTLAADLRAQRNLRRGLLCPGLKECFQEF